MKKILFPTDFSENSKDALNYILEMNKNEDLELEILNVVDANHNFRDNPMSAVQVLEDLSAAAEKGLESLQLLINSFPTRQAFSLKLNTTILTGNPVLKILEHAKVSEPDLIVLGNKGENYSIIDKLLGNTSLSTAVEASCPVLLIPKDFKYKSIVTVLFPTNLDYSDPYILWKSMKVIRPHQPIIRCLHIRDENKKPNLAEEASFAKYIQDHSPSIQTIYQVENGSTKDIENLVDEYSNNYDCQLIIMHKSKKSFFQKLFSKSNTQEIRRHLNLPLLIMNLQQ